MARASIPPSVQTEILLKCKRRCALCYGLNNDLTEKRGQIAHINGKNDDPRIDNLAFICIEHHDIFDSVTSVSKNITSGEVKEYRDRLTRHFSKSRYEPEDVSLIQNYLRNNSTLFNYCFSENEQLAYCIDHNIWTIMQRFLDGWHSSKLRSFDSELRRLQDQIYNSIREIFRIYDADIYDLTPSWIKFDNTRHKQSELYKRRDIVKPAVASMYAAHVELEAVAVF